jgi:hypothetical protein
MRFYKITANDTNRRKVMSTLKSQRVFTRKDNGDIVVAIGNKHQSWLPKVCADFHANLVRLDSLPKSMRHPLHDEYIAPCGEVFYDPLMKGQHIRFCSKCQAIRKSQVSKPPESPKPSPTTVAKLEPGEGLSWDGVIRSLETTREQLMEKAAELDGLVNNLQTWKSSRHESRRLMDEAQLRMNAVRKLLEKGESKLLE